MTFRPVLLLLLSVTACIADNAADPCGTPSKIWVHTGNFVYPHHAAIHNIEVNHMNDILVNNAPRDEKGLRKFLAELADDQWDVLLFDFDAHADCDQVRNIRRIIESSKFCAQKNCVYGDPGVEPPEFKPDERRPS